jgi:hypothetical protein
MKIGEHILLPKDSSLTETGIKHQKKLGNNIPLSKYKILNMYWEQCQHPYPHSCKRIELKKGTGKTYIKYLETVESILITLNTKN